MEFSFAKFATAHPYKFSKVAARPEMSRKRHIWSESGALRPVHTISFWSRKQWYSTRNPLFYHDLGSGRVETVASNSVTCIQLAIAARQSNMCAAPLNMSVVT